MIIITAPFIGSNPLPYVSASIDEHGQVTLTIHANPHLGGEDIQALIPKHKARQLGEWLLEHTSED